MIEDTEALLAKLNQETGKLTWPEIEKHYARGAVIKVEVGVDLLEVAVAMARDDKEQVARWLEAGRIGRARDDDACDWSARDPIFWAVVVAPWLLIQEVAAS